MKVYAFLTEDSKTFANSFNSIEEAINNYNFYSITAFGGLTKRFFKDKDSNPLGWYDRETQIFTPYDNDFQRISLCLMLM